MLTGLTRHRLAWRKKMVLQVSEWRRTFVPGRAPWLDGYQAVWRDATFQDVMDLERRNFSDKAPKVEAPPMPQTRHSPPPMPSVKPPALAPSVAQMPVQEFGSVAYQWINLTGIEDE